MGQHQTERGAGDGDDSNYEELTYEGYGPVAYLFSKQGIISYSPEMDEDRLMEAALVAGAEDLDDVQNVYHNADIPAEVMEALHQ